MEENILQVLNTEYYHKYQVCPEGETPGGLSKRRMEGTGFLKAIDTIQNFYDKNPQWLPRTKDEAIIRHLYTKGDKMSVKKLTDYHLYITEYNLNENKYAGEFFADNMEEAQEICKNRGLGETIIGISDGREQIFAFLHSVCFACYMAVKGGKMTIDEALSDQGLIHEIIHLLDRSGLTTDIDTLNKKLQKLNEYTRLIPRISIPTGVVNAI